MSFTSKSNFRNELYQVMREDIGRAGWRTKVEALINRELAHQERKAQFVYDGDNELPAGLEAVKQSFIASVKG
ncbi:MAG: hypothetical protein JRJ75_16665 [Deltaproteobacteria bacterium]|nr:hypothetical protein [Deltaproteobacteria bacterium]